MMKREECKFRMPEEHSLFLNAGKHEPFKHKKMIIFAWILVLITLLITIGFTFRALTEIGELKEEIEKMKSSIQVLQKKSNDLDSPEDTVYVEENRHYDDEYYDVSYEDEDSEDLYDLLPDNLKRLTTGEDYTKDVKQVSMPARSKRSIIGYTQDDSLINSELYQDQRKKNLTHRDTNYYHSTPPPTRFRMHQDNYLTPKTPKMASYLRSGDTYTSRENPDAESGIFGDDIITSGRTKHRQRRLELDERSVKYGRMRPLPAAHFNGDTSKYVYGQHEHFDGNGRLRHPQKTFVDWVESGWFETLEMDRYFSFSDGILTVKDSGIYFIYAQIYYLDKHDTNGFRVYRNETDTLLQCTTMTHSEREVLKGNTCFTAAAEYLHQNDRISLGDLSGARYSLFEPGKSFFGIIKLGDVRIVKRK